MLTREREESSFEALLHAYLEELERRRYSASSLKQARQLLPLFFSHLKEKGIEDLRAVTEEHLVSYARWLQKKKTKVGEPLSLWTQSVYLSAVKRFFTFLDRRNVILRNPALTLRLPRARRLPRRLLSEAQVRRLLQAPSGTTALGIRDRALLETLYGTAVRRTECVGVDVSDVDLHEGSLWVREGKGKKDRLLPIPAMTAEVLDRYLKESRPRLLRDPHQLAFFLSVAGNRLSPSHLDGIVRGYGVVAGIPFPVHAHALRHACATHLLGRGADLRHIQELLGHSHIRTTALYTRVNVSDLRAVFAKAHPRELQWRKKRSPRR